MIALTSLYASIYVLLVYSFQPISFRAIQVRVADAMIALIPIFGWAGVLGYTLGVFIANLMSPLGAIDLLSTIPSFIGGYIVYKGGHKHVLETLAIQSIIIASWVGFELNLVFGVPFFFGIGTVFVGEIISSYIIGYPLYLLLRKRLILV